MFVSHVRRPVDASLLFLVEPCVPDDFAELAQSAGFAPTQWHPVSRHLMRDADHRPADFLDLCRFSYGRGFNRGLQDPKSDNWQFQPVYVLCRLSPAEPFEVRELRLFNRLIEETGENPLAYLLAELRVMGETHAKQYVSQEATV